MKLVEQIWKTHVGLAKNKRPIEANLKVQLSTWYVPLRMQKEHCN